MRHWGITGTHAHEYQLVKGEELPNGGRSATLRCAVPEPGGFGAQVQVFSAEQYRGKRVRLSGRLRADGVTDWCGLWMRVDGPRGEQLGFDNMNDRALRGTTDWLPCHVVLDVDEHASQILIGTILSRRGAVHMADFAFEVVGDDVPTTGKQLRDAPENLSFDEDE